MGLAMIVSLYTSRIVLDVLGETDFGIWSVVATLIVSVSFITSPLSAATQRFLNVELGKNDTKSANSIFCSSVQIYVCLAIILLIVFETIGIWFLNEKMDIPIERIHSANIVFQFASASFIINIVRIPYDSTIIAYEKFNFYAIIGIIDVIFKLVIVFILYYAHNNNALTMYAYLTFTVNVVIAAIYIIYCKKNYPLTKFRFVKDKNLIVQLLSFSGWSTFGAVASMTSNQGISIILNIFFGVTINAALGLANSVANAVNQFVGNFQIAFQPQIVKKYSSGNKTELMSLISFSTKISFFLIFAISCPLSFNINYILQLWLTEVPDYTAVFIILILGCAIIEAIGAPLWMSIQAVGMIKKYQIFISTALISIIFISWACLMAGCQPYVVLIIKLGIVSICFIIRLLFSHKYLQFSVSQVIKEIYLRLLIIAVIVISCMIIACNYLYFSDFSWLCISSLIFILVFIPTAILIGFNKTQRESILIRIKNYHNRPRGIS